MEFSAGLNSYDYLIGIKCEDTAATVRTEITEPEKTEEDLRKYIENNAVIMDSLSSSMGFSIKGFKEAMDTYSDASYVTQLFMQVTASGLKTGSILAKISGPLGIILAFGDAAVFIEQKVYAAKQNQLVKTIAQGRGQYCVWNTESNHLCGLWSTRPGVCGNYICRYYDYLGTGKKQRCTVVVNDYRVPLKTL